MTRSSSSNFADVPTVELVDVLAEADAALERGRAELQRLKAELAVHAEAAKHGDTGAAPRSERRRRARELEQMRRTIEGVEARREDVVGELARREV